MARPIWSGSISFGLVNIPIRLYNTVKRKTLHFHQLRKKDSCRIRLKKICPVDGKEVLPQDIVKGYEISPDQYVIVNTEELDALSPKATRTIEIEDFVKLEQINPTYFEASYYILPEAASVKAYHLLLAAMEHTHKVAVAKFVLRNKEHLAILRLNGSLLILSTLFYQNEIIAQSELEDELVKADQPPTEKELNIALQLVESLSNDFQPEKYKDEFQAKVLSLIQKKAEGETVTAPSTEQNKPGNVVDLMAALEASVSAIKKQKTAGTRKKKIHAAQN
ncbi:non-homologous end joining protein Ku [Propionispora hippei]|uniref:Non-homologous end joining protein Ku n=1 Tax=Propionispora hippei DSM 15287 TaxID=1123003 RepID=A0A1M6N5B8_9FIRM|nr:Ku protein [Propionispora hippei]SHJ90826.1 DNA end-binding protein Ku [Propionispora hippei DSM 15287]